MTRYHFDAAWSGQQLHENDCLVPWDKGEWVRFKDAQADKAKLVEALKEIIEDDSTWAHIQNKCYAAIEGVS